jgi:hypothetical protein
MEKIVSVAIATIIVTSLFVGVVSAREGELSVYPDTWSETITAGEYETESFLVQNKAGFGDCPVKGIKVSKVSGPDWLTFTTSTDLGDLKNVSFSRHFEIMIAPPIDVLGSFEYELRVSCTYGHPAYQDIRGRITVEPAVIPTPRPTPTPVETPTTGQIAIGSSPEGSSLYIDGEYYGETEYYNPKPIGLKAGTYTIKLAKDGYKDYTETITVEGGYIHKKTIILESLPVTPTETPITPEPTSTPTPPEPTQTPVTTPTETTPAFEAIFAIAGLSTVVYILRRTRK